MLALNGNVVIITGGSFGIGRPAALDISERGTKVIIKARDAAVLENAAADHPNITGMVADAAAPEDAVRTIAEAVDTWGRLDVLVNNAGAGALMPLPDARAVRIMKMFAVNVLGPSLRRRGAALLATAKEMIINVWSTFGHKPAAGLSHYVASCAGAPGTMLGTRTRAA